MIYGGPFWARRVNRALSRRLRASAFRTLDDARR
jgi:dihydroorotate dehydrogenase